METVDAIVIQSDEKCEVRCAKCGKMLFTFKFSSKKGKIPVDNMSRNVIIVSRCTRSDCKADNLLVIS